MVALNWLHSSSCSSRLHFANFIVILHGGITTPDRWSKWPAFRDSSNFRQSKSQLLDKFHQCICFTTICVCPFETHPRYYCMWVKGLFWLYAETGVILIWFLCLEKGNPCWDKNLWYPPIWYYYQTNIFSLKSFSWIWISALYGNERNLWIGNLPREP